ncbi:unnamed protein product [Calypogeia fissa]
MAMTITPAEASAIIAMKYPDLSEGFPIPDAIICTPPPPTRLRRKRPPHSPAAKRMKLVDHFNQMADRSLTIFYPSIYSTEDYQEEDAFLPYVSPLKAERMSSFLRVRSLSTPTKKSKRGSRSLLESANKRFRAHQTYHSTVNLKHKILRLCGASKWAYNSSKYMSIPGKEDLELELYL